MEVFFTSYFFEVVGLSINFCVVINDTMVVFFGVLGFEVQVLVGRSC